jgi:hypothetical protein
MAPRLRARDPWAGYFAIRQRLTKSALRALRVDGGR